MIFGDFEYSVNENNEIIIYKYLGENSFVSVPESIDGKTVTEIGDGAFRNKRCITDLILPKGLQIIGNYAFCECRGLKEVSLPEGLLEAGGHAFYNCRNLEKMEIPTTIEFIADGFIKNCEVLKEVYVITDGRLGSAVAGFLINITNEIEVTFVKQNMKFLLPEYDYEYVANAPAKIFVTLTHGSGEFFRRAIESKGFDYKFYDENFKRAVFAEKKITSVKMALCRIMYPYRLDEKYKESYINFIKENIADVVSYACEKDDILIIEKIDENGCFNNENISEAIEEAAKSTNSEISAYIMDIKLSRFGRKKKTFDL